MSARAEPEPGLPELAALVDRIVEPERPDAPALLLPDGRVAATHGALAGLVRARAGAWARAGFEPGAAVAFGVRQDPDGIAWLLGAIRAGIVVVVLDPGVAPDNLVRQARAAGVSALVTDGLVATVARHPILRTIAARRGVRLPAPGRLARAHWTTGFSLTTARRLDRLAGGDARRPLTADAPALVLFTSGTTAAPRGVVHSSGSLAATLAGVAGEIALGPDDRVLGSGLHVIAPALLAGATAVLPPAGDDPVALAAVTRRLGVTHATMPLHRALAWSAAGGAGPSFRHLLLGSAPVRNAGLRALVAGLPRVDVGSAYGLTEYLLVARVGATERLQHDERDGDLVGRSIAGARLRVADDGELWVAGPGLARGYLGGEPTPVAELPTGDLGRIEPNGRIVLVGRRKDMLLRNGVNIYPTLYESALEDRAGVAAAAMVGVPGPDGDQTVVLFGVPRGGETPERARERLTRLVRSHESPLDEHARPDLVLGIAALPRAGRSDKLDRRALALIAAAHLGRTFVDDPALHESTADRPTAR